MTTPTRFRRMCVALAALTCAGAAWAQTMSRDQAATVLKAAIDKFDQAVAAQHDDPETAESLYRDASIGFESLVAGGFDNAALHYNLGNAYFRLHDAGRAVVCYRRAQRLDPRNERVDANLRYVRARVEPAIAATGEAQLVDRLLFWNRYLSMHARFRIAAVASAGGWVALLLWTRFRTPMWIAAALAGIAVGLANGASVAWQIHDEQARPPAVVVGATPTLRSNRAENAEPVLSAPLGPGVELRILQQRGDWVEVRLADDRSGWLPAATIMRV